jgi:hypothetical protein
MSLKLIPMQLLRRLPFLFGLLYYANACEAQDSLQTTFYFETAKWELNENEFQLLDSMLAALNDEITSFDFIIQGHTDNDGNHTYNQQLSEMRCRSLKNELLKRGIPSSSIKMEGYSFDHPAVMNDSEENKAKNRRAIFLAYPSTEVTQWKFDPQKFNLNRRKTNTITSKNGCKFTIPADAFMLSEDLWDGDLVRVEITEYNTPADFLASGLPMSFETGKHLFAYESHEMFRIEAYQNKRSLQLKPDVQIHLTCGTLDTLFNVGFYQYNLTEEVWKEEDSKKEDKQEEDKKELTEDQKKEQQKEIAERELQKVLDKYDFKSHNSTVVDAASSGSETDTVGTGKCIIRPYDCDSLEQAIDEILELTEHPLIFENDTSWTNYFDQRFEDKGYVGLKELIEVSDVQKEITIGLNARKRLFRNKYVLSFDYDGARNPELDEIVNVKWLISGKENQENIYELAELSFSDVRIVMTNGNDAILRLKYLDRIIELAAEVFRPKKNTMNQIAAYQVRLKSRRDKFNKSERLAAKQFYRTAMSKYYCTYLLFCSFSIGEGSRLPYNLWIPWFNAHREEIRAEFLLLRANVDEIRERMNCVPIGHWDKVEVPKGNRKMIVFGIYNFDTVIPLESVLVLDAPIFQTSRHKIIEPALFFLMINDLNGLISLSGKQGFRLVKDHLNSIIIVDQFNQRYICNVDLRKSNSLANNQFTMKNVTVETRTMEGLQRTLEFYQRSGL